ncbi:MAG: hypothetical protein HKN04_13855 [Rhodothermaceae bacterium]|nr:hypothetical protein [Rhodothermaceae bacterium]
MKLRIQDDSLRLRLTRPEVERLASEGRVESVTHIALGQALRYVLRTAAAEGIRASFEATTLTVSLPSGWVEGWPEDERVGFEGTQDVGDGRTLALLVEKDFQCLHRDAEEPDAFPNPLAADAK